MKIVLVMEMDIALVEMYASVTQAGREDIVTLVCHDCMHTDQHTNLGMKVKHSNATFV